MRKPQPQGAFANCVQESIRVILCLPTNSIPGSVDVLRRVVGIDLVILVLVVFLKVGIRYGQRLWDAERRSDGIPVRMLQEPFSYSEIGRRITDAIGQGEYAANSLDSAVLH